jgi:hypothetical protein
LKILVLATTIINKLVLRGENNLKHFSILLAINLLISFFYDIISKNSNSFAFINCAFIIGMVYFLSGCLCYVWEKGFFNITLFSFSKISQEIQKRRGILTDDYNISLDDYVYRKNKFFLTSNLLICGGVVSILCIILSFLYI